MLVDRRAVVFLAAHARSAVRARLSRRPRSRASRRDESFAPVLAAAAAPVPGNAPRQGLAQRARRRPASLRRAAAGGLDSSLRGARRATKQSTDRARCPGLLRFRLRAPRFGGLQARRSSRSERRQVARNDDYLISTSVTSLTRLLASTGLPSRVTSMLRTMSPPPGMAQVWNFCVCGSNRTPVFGLAKDSLYHSAPLVKTMP